MQHAFPLALQHALQHFPQFSTMFVRASFARGKVFRTNGIHRWPWMPSIGRTIKMWKNVEILAHPEEGLTMPPSTSQDARLAWGIASLAALLIATPSRADDWPQFRGPNRDGVWREAGILDTIPAAGLQIRWRAKV